MGVHPHFVGYLCLKRLATEIGSEEDLSPDFKSFHETFLKISGHPTGFPYLRIFVDKPPSENNLFLNKNVAGSYAPSSIRDNFRKIVTITGTGREAKFTLNSQHWMLARTHLCKEKKIPVVELSVVLYRDYSVTGDNPSLADFVEVFKEEFGYLSSSPSSTIGGDKEFDILYDYEDQDASDLDSWLEEV